MNDLLGGKVEPLYTIEFDQTGTPIRMIKKSLMLLLHWLFKLFSIL